MAGWSSALLGIPWAGLGALLAAEIDWINGGGYTLRRFGARTSARCAAGMAEGSWWDDFNASLPSFHVSADRLAMIPWAVHAGRQSRPPAPGRSRAGGRQCELCGAAYLGNHECTGGARCPRYYNARRRELEMASRLLATDAPSGVVAEHRRGGESSRGWGHRSDQPGESTEAASTDAGAASCRLPTEAPSIGLSAAESAI